jgi:serine/threonine-protein kinase
LLALLGLILLGAIGFLAAQVFSGLPSGGVPSPSASAQTISMPDWTNKTPAQAQIQATELGITIAEPYGEGPSDEIEEGRIISTDPAANEPVEKGGTVRITVSTGPESVVVPPLIGQTPDQAQRTLDQAGLQLGSVGSEYSDEAEGTIIRTVPAVGEEVEPGRSVDVIVSRGPEPTATPSPTPEQAPEPTPTPSPPPTPPPATPTPTPPPTATPEG